MFTRLLKERNGHQNLKTLSIWCFSKRISRKSLIDTLGTKRSKSMFLFLKMWVRTIKQKKNSKCFKLSRNLILLIWDRNCFVINNLSLTITRITPISISCSLSLWIRNTWILSLKKIFISKTNLLSLGRRYPQLNIWELTSTIEERECRNYSIVWNQKLMFTFVGYWFGLLLCSIKMKRRRISELNKSLKSCRNFIRWMRD